MAGKLPQGPVKMQKVRATGASLPQAVAKAQSAAPAKGGKNVK